MQELAVAALLGIADGECTVAGNLTAVADLTAALCIERCAVENQDTVGACFQRINSLAVRENCKDLCLALGLGIAGKFRFRKSLRNSRIAAPGSLDL